MIPLEKGRAGEETPTFAVEVTYVQRGGAWQDKGRGALALPAVDLPIARTGVVLHHSPRYRVTAEPGAFRVETRQRAVQRRPQRQRVVGTRAAPPPEAAPQPAEADERSCIQPRGRRTDWLAGPLPVSIPFPNFGQGLFLRSELTAELQAPSLGFSYKRESRW